MQEKEEGRGVEWKPSETNLCSFPGQYHLLRGSGMEDVAGSTQPEYQRHFPLASYGCVLLIAHLWYLS